MKLLSYKQSIEYKYEQLRKKLLELLYDYQKFNYEKPTHVILTEEEYIIVKHYGYMHCTFNSTSAEPNTWMDLTIIKE